MLLFTCLSAVIVGLGIFGYMFLGRNRYGGERPLSLQLTASKSALENGSVKPEPYRIVRVYFMKPSRYDEEGYVMFYRYGVQPNNTLTVMAALNDTLNKRFAAERNVFLETILWDEVCDGVVSPDTIKAIKDK